MAPPLFLPIETSLNLNVLIWGLTGVELMGGLVGPHSRRVPAVSRCNSSRTEAGNSPCAASSGERRTHPAPRTCKDVYHTRVLPQIILVMDLLRRGVSRSVL